jgi:ubiquinone/menaquinone biosynthesis C-methylase UbiE
VAEFAATAQDVVGLDISAQMLSNARDYVKALGRKNCLSTVF